MLQFGLFIDMRFLYLIMCSVIRIAVQDWTMSVVRDSGQGEEYCSCSCSNWGGCRKGCQACYSASNILFWTFALFSLCPSTQAYTMGLYLVLEYHHYYPRFKMAWGVAWWWAQALSLTRHVEDTAFFKAWHKAKICMPYIYIYFFHFIIQQYNDINIFTFILEEE